MDVWNYQGVGNIEVFLSIFKVRLKDMFMQNWHSRLEESTRARLYITIAKFEYNIYLDILTVEKFRRNLSKLRLSSHRLEVEVGRWAKPNKISLNERKCKICDVLEDEFHFVLECIPYKDLRERYIHAYYWKRPNMPKFIDLLTSENEKVLKQLSTYIEKAFTVRKEILSA